ncbi:MAG: hypothetical protein H7321_05970 [Bacteroidia bacterium]|nr:hypothetical protein [Bacteroidia bacterium]
MKKIIIAAFLVWKSGTVFAQIEDPKDYFLPFLSNEIILDQRNTNDLESPSFIGSDYKRTYTTYPDAKGETVYEYSYEMMDEDIFSYDKTKTYHLKFIGQDVKIIGFRNYSGSYSENKYKKITEQTLVRFPENSWQSESWAYTSPETGQIINCTSEYKKFKINGKDVIGLKVTGKYPNGTVYYSMYVKGIGLYWESYDSDESLVNELYPLERAENYGYNSETEETLRPDAWKIRARLLDLAKDSNILYSDYQSKWNTGYDSLLSLCISASKTKPDMINFYKYLLFTANSEFVSNYFVFSDDRKGTSIFPTEEKIDRLFYLRPNENTYNYSQLRTYTTASETSYANTYKSAIRYKGVQFIFDSYYFNDTFSARKIVWAGNQFDRIAGTDQEDNNEYVYNAMYYAYKKLNDPETGYKYKIQAFENLYKLKKDMKDNNIEYIKSSAKIISDYKSSNPEYTARAVSALRLYGFDKMALDKARGAGNITTKEFGFAYADAAYKLNENMDLQNAVLILEPYVKTMTKEEQTKMREYYNKLGDQKKAKDIDKKLSTKVKVEKTKSTLRGNNSGVNFAISTNPMNFYYKGQMGAVDLRIKKLLIEGRYQNFNDVTSENIFAGRLVDPKHTFTGVKGADYSAALYVMPEIENRRSEVSGLYFGVQAMASSITSVSQNVSYTYSETNLKGTSKIHPAMNRQELTFNYGYIYFDKKYHLFFNAYMGVGAGVKHIKYGNTDGVDLSDKTKVSFDKTAESFTFDPTNWGKTYIQVRMGIRIGITIF